MTTATKKPSTADPSSDIFAAPASVLPQPAAAPDPPVPCLEKREALEAMADDLDQRRIQMLTAGTSPDAGLFDAVENFTIALADPDLVWCRRDWPFLDVVGRFGDYFCRVLQEGDWRTTNRIDSTFWRHLGDVLEGCRTLTFPPPVPQPRKVKLETLAQLDALVPKISDAQIAVMYDWYDADGHPDRMRVARARENPADEPTPTYSEIPAEGSFPTRAPSIHLLLHVADRFAAERAGR